MTFVVKKASPGIDALGILNEHLGEGFEVREFEDELPLIEQIADANALLTRAIPITADVIDAAPGLRVIQRPGIHLEGIDVEHAQLRGIHVARVPAEARIGVKGVPVAEHSLALLLGVTKSLHLARPSFATGTVGLPTTEQLAGMRLGLVGMGRIGAALVPMARALDMEVACVRTDPSASGPDGLEWVGGSEDLHRLLGWSQIVSMHLPLTPETHGIIGRAELAVMPRGSYLINTARAELIDEAALRDAMAAGHLAGFGTDLWWNEPADADDPLLANPRVVATPHIAAMTVAEMRGIYTVVADNMRRVAAGEAPEHAI